MTVITNRKLAVVKKYIFFDFRTDTAFRFKHQLNMKGEKSVSKLQTSYKSMFYVIKKFYSDK